MKLWVHAVLCGLTFVVIGCSKHHQPMQRMQSRDKETIKTVAKSSQAKGSGRLKQTTQATTGVLLRLFVIMLAFLSQVTSGVVGLKLPKVLMPCPILSVNDYQRLNYTFPLNLSPSFDDSNFKAFLAKLSDKTHTNYVTSACCHLFSKEDIDIDVITFCTTEQERRYTFSQCSEHCAKELDSVLEQVQYVSHPSDQRPITHYVMRSNNLRSMRSFIKGNIIGEDQNGALEVYPSAAFVHRDSDYFSAFREEVVVRGSNEYGHNTIQKQIHYRSIQDVFDVILNINNRSERIIQLREARKKILEPTILRQWCRMPDDRYQTAARHWISAGLECFYLEQYEEKILSLQNYLKQRANKAKNPGNQNYSNKQTEDSTAQAAEIKKLKKEKELLNIKIIKLEQENANLTSEYNELNNKRNKERNLLMKQGPQLIECQKECPRSCTPIELDNDTQYRENWKRFLQDECPRHSIH